VKKLELDWIPGLMEIVEFTVKSEPPKDTLPSSNEAWK
jgi:hypothetical protein